jgi:YVTN family beta-propeller protein
VYVANTFADDVSVISTLTGTVIATVTVGRAPTDVDIARIVHATPDGAPGRAPAAAPGRERGAASAGDVNSSRQQATGALTCRSRTRAGDDTANENKVHRRARHRPVPPRAARATA